MKRAWKNLRIAFRQVFARPAYIALASLLAIGVMVFTLWFPNLALITTVITEPDASLATTLAILLSLLGTIGTNFSLFSAGYTVAIAALFGVNVAMIVYLLRRRRVAAAGQNLALGTGGMASGMLGVGCAACGSLTASTALSFFGGAGAIAMLPLNGGEFGILSVVLLAVSVLLLGRSIAQASCPLPVEKAGNRADEVVIRKSN